MWVPVCFERVDDIDGADAAVQVAFVVGVGFDRHALLADFCGQCFQARETLAFDFQ